MAVIYQRAANRGYALDDKFDTELADLLTRTYGDPESVQLEIKDSFAEAIENNAGRGDLITTNMETYLTTSSSQVLSVKKPSNFMGHRYCSHCMHYTNKV